MIDVYAGAMGFVAFLSNILIMFVVNHVFDRAEPYSEEAIMYNTIHLAATVVGLAIMVVTLTCFHPIFRKLFG